MGWRWGQREEREKKKKEGERQEKFFQRKMQGLSLTLTSDRALINPPPPRAVGRGISAAPDGPGQSLGPAPRRGDWILWAARSMPLPLTSRHEVVPALDTGSSDSSRRGRRPGHGESCLQGLNEGTQIPFSSAFRYMGGQIKRGWKCGGKWVPT